MNRSGSGLCYRRPYGGGIGTRIVSCVYYVNARSFNFKTIDGNTENA